MKNSISWNEYFAAYQNASAETQNLIDSGLVSTCIENSFPTLTDEEKPLLLIEVANYLVGLLDKESLISSFTELEGSSFEELIQCLDQASGTPSVESESVIDNNDDTSESKPPTGLRTMATDIELTKRQEAEPTYTSSQEALLREGRRGTASEATAAAEPGGEAGAADTSAAATPSTPPAASGSPKDDRWGS